MNRFEDIGLMGWCFFKASALLCFLVGHDWTPADCDGCRFCCVCGKGDY